MSGNLVKDVYSWFMGDSGMSVDPWQVDESWGDSVDPVMAVDESCWSMGDSIITRDLVNDSCWCRGESPQNMTPAFGVQGVW